MENSFISVSKVETLSDEDSPSIERKPSQSPEVKENQQPLPSSSTKSQKPIIIDAPKNPEMYNRLVSVDPEKRLYGGKMTDQRMNKVHQITGDVIAAIHSSLPLCLSTSICAVNCIHFQCRHSSANQCPNRM
uniref:Uncharacterized protein n=1 Tax=Ditylenchus dipsaci TaxID=166011 RepID=A0A915D440_9BILA